MLSPLFLGYFAYALFQSAPHLTGGDCGEYVAAGAYLGNPHAPGNPVHHLLTYLVQRVPLGDAYSRSAALSSLSAAGVVALLCHLLRRAGESPLVSWGTALLFGFSATVLRDAVVTEVYTLLLLFSGVFTALYLGSGETPDGPPGREAFRLPFLAGLGMGIHFLSVFFTLPLLIDVWWRKGRRPSELAAGFLLFLAGSAVMLYLPARAMAHPPVNYGNPETLEAFLDSVAWRTYASRPLKNRDLLLFLRQAGWAAGAFLSSVSAALLPLALLGIAGKRNARRFLPLLASSGLFFAANVFFHNFPSRILTGTDMPRFLGPAALPLFLLAGSGLGRLLDAAGASGGRDGRTGAPGRAAVSLFAALVAVTGWRAAALHSRADDFLVRDYTREAFLAAPPNAAIVLDGDTAVFSALATHFVERMRTDLLPIDRTESHLASIYENLPLRPSGKITESDLAERETSFAESYPEAVGFLVLPEWAAAKGPIERRGGIALVKPGPPSRYAPPPAAAVRFAPNIATSGDIKTRAVLLKWLLDDPARAAGDRPPEGFEPLLWDQAGFQAFAGVRLQEAGRIEEAERRYRRSLEIYPAYLPGKRSLGVLLARMKRTEEAHAVLSDPDLGDFPEGQFHLGNHYARLGMHGHAVERYERARFLGYRTASLYNNLGVAYLLQGNTAKAREMLEEALRLNPEYGGARENLERLKRSGERGNAPER